MNVHKNARLTIEGRKLLVERIAVIGLTPAAEAAGVSLRTARKWLDRFRLGGPNALADRSSRPRRVRSSLDDVVLRSIEQLRRLRMPMRRIAELVGRSVSTVSRALDRLGLSSLRGLDPVRPLVRYEHVAPGEMLHIDTKKLGRIARPSHRVTGNRRDSVEGAGWEFAHVAIDDHSRAGFVQMHADERKDSPVEFLKASVAHFAAHGRQDQAALDRQRLGLPLQALQQDLPGTRHQAHLHPALHTADQRQGRALHPDLPARVGLRSPVEQQPRAHLLAAGVPRLLQQPPPTLRSRR